VFPSVLVVCVFMEITFYRAYREKVVLYLCGGFLGVVWFGGFDAGCYGGFGEGCGSCGELG
jgi:hypothetical protein